MKLNGAEIIIKELENHGIKIIAGIPGGANLPMYRALSESSIKHVLARHEQGGGFIAQGMARSTGKAAVCFATSGPATTNLFTALADAKSDSVPVIFITGQVPRSLSGTDAFQEIDTKTIAEPMSKAVFYIDEAKNISRCMREAFRIATAGRPGPVLIDVPKDVQKDIIDYETCEFHSDVTKEIDTQISFDWQIIAAELNNAKRPVFFIGGGAVISGAGDLIRGISDEFDIKITSSLMGISATSKDHHNYIGMLGMHGSPEANGIVRDSDLLICCGVRFSDRTTGKLDEFCPDAKIIHIDIDPSENGKIMNPDYFVCADLKDALAQIRPFLKKATREYCEYDREYFQDGSAMGNIFSRIRTGYGEDAIITTDVGQHQMWTAQYCSFSRPRTFLTSAGLGTMGFGLPAAIGAALANPEKKVICISGDGSLLMNIQELALISELRLNNIKIILFNNQELGLVRQQQDFFYDRKHCGSEYRQGHDFIKIAEGFGVKGATCKYDQDERFSEILISESIQFIDLRIEKTEDVYPMVKPGKANIDMIRKEEAQMV